MFKRFTHIKNTEFDFLKCLRENIFCHNCEGFTASVNNIQPDTGSKLNTEEV